MQRPLGYFLARALPLLFSACAVDTPVVEGETSGDFRSRCETLCERIETCAAVTLEQCQDECVTVFERFEDYGEICSEAGERVMRCLERAPCAEVEWLDACSLSEESERCLDSVEPTTCETRDTSGSGLPDCEHSLRDCSNGREYELVCFEGSSAARCACMTNGVLQGEFAAVACPPIEDAIRICAWPVAPDGATRTSRCVGGGNTGPSCNLVFEQCADGHSYGVTCAAVKQAVRCECDVDGVVVGSYSSADGICEFADDTDDGRIATNYACGFSIQTIPQSAGW